MTITQIDRGIYETIRESLISFGLLVDIRNYVAGQEEQYKEDKKTLNVSLKTTNKTIIEIFGVGSSQDRGEKNISRITIDRKHIQDGSFGVGSAKVYEKYTNNQNEEKYRKLGFPSQKAKSISYDIRIITNSITMERVMLDFLNILFKDFAMIKTRLDGNIEGESFELIKQDTISIPTKQDWVEWLFTFKTSDIFINDMIVEKEEIAPMNTTTFNINT